MKKNNLCVVTGSGRCGTTVFMEICEALNKTSLQGTAYNNKIKGGYEIFPPLEQWTTKINNLPKVIKDPRFLITLPLIIEKHDINVNHAFLLVRDFTQAALSREDKDILYSAYPPMLEQYGTKEGELKRQVVFFQRAIGNFIEQIAKLDISLTILHFPRFIKDINYTYNKLKNTPIECEFEDLKNAFEKCVKTDLVNVWKKK